MNLAQVARPLAAIGCERQWPVLDHQKPAKRAASSAFLIDFSRI
jgi:hypothetical protein